MILRHFFTEAPYAAAVCTDHLLDRCSFCFDAAKGDWACTCGHVVYCSEQCRQADRRWHECECIAFRSNRRPKSASMDVEIRLLGRLMTRYLFDKGAAVLSSSAFPSSFVKDRCMDDLMSHERDYVKKPWYEYQSSRTTHWFMIFFNSTPLASVKPEVLKRWNCVASINGFSVTSLTIPGVPDSLSYLGETVYLNASRFDHSCQPSLVFGFNGCQLVVKYVDHEGAYGNGESTKTMTKKQFKKLTFNYGFGTSWNYGTSFSMTSQRIESLRARYFFRCRCSLCQDKKTNRLQAHSSQVDCSMCGVPYVWLVKRWSNKANLTRACRCPWNEEVANKSHWCHDRDVQQCAKRLNDEWKCTMERACKAASASEVLDVCEPFRHLAMQYWSKTHNVRLGQLCEKIYEAYWKKLYVIKNTSTISQATDSQRSTTSSTNPVKTPSFQEVLKTTLEVGEIMISTYTRYAEPYNLAMGIFAHRLASLYCMSTDEHALTKASHFCLKAGEVWKLHGYDDCQKYFEKLSDHVLSRGKMHQEATKAPEPSPVIVDAAIV